MVQQIADVLQQAQLTMENQQLWAKKWGREGGREGAGEELSNKLV